MHYVSWKDTFILPVYNAEKTNKQKTFNIIYFKEMKSFNQPVQLKSSQPAWRTYEIKQHQS